MIGVVTTSTLVLKRPEDTYFATLQLGKDPLHLCFCAYNLLLEHYITSTGI